MRLEQLYPLPVDEIKAQLARYPDAEDFVWVQEEPANQGAWSFIALNLLEHLDGVPMRRVSRPAAAAPAGRLDQDCTTPSRPPSSRPPCPAPEHARAPAIAGECQGHFTHARDHGILREEPCTSPTGASRSWSSGAATETVTIEWLAERLRDFIDLNPEFETPVERFATWLARLDDEDE